VGKEPDKSKPVPSVPDSSGSKTPTDVPVGSNDPKLVKIEPADGAKVKWYVNLPADETKKQGRDVTVKAYVEPKAAGVAVYFFIDQDNVSSRTISEDSEDLAASVAAKLDKTSVKTDGEGVAAVKFKLASYGGDKYRIYASLKKDAAKGDAGNVQTCEVEVWRKINYELEVMARPDTGDYSDLACMGTLAEKWKDLFIEASSVGDDSKPKFQIVTQADIKKGDYQKAFRKGATEPAYLQILYVHDISLGIKEETYEQKLKAVPEGSSYTDDVSVDYTGYVFDPKDWFISCSWKSGSKSGKFKKDDKNDDVTLALGVKAKDGTTVDRITIKSTSVAEVRSPRADVTITLKFKHMSVLAGYSYGDTAVVACAPVVRPKLATDDARNSLMTCLLHEAGHSLGLAMKATARKKAKNLAKANITYEKGGLHCHEASDTCVMFDTIPQTSPVRDPSFGDYCKDAMRALNLTKPGTAGSF